MAHRIEEMDKIQTVTEAWHGLSEILEKIKLEDCFLSQWDVEPVTLFGPDGQEIITAGNEMEPGTGYKILRCTDNGAYIGKPFSPDSYTPINNARFLQLVRDSISGTKHQVVSVGSVCNRGRIFVSVKLAELEMFKAAGREFEPYLNLGTSHDMSCVLFVNTSNFATVCNNTFTANLTRNGKIVNARIKHTKNAPAKLENLPEVIDAAIGVQAEFAHALSTLAKESCNMARAERIYTGFLVKGSLEELADRENGPISTRTQNQINRLGELFVNGKGNRGKDLSDCFSAITDYYSHESAGGANRMKQFTSSEFGSGLRKKVEFWDTIRDEKSLAQTETRGEKILAMA